MWFKTEKIGEKCKKKILSKKCECVCVCNSIWLTLVSFISGPRPAGKGWISGPGATNLSWTRPSLIKPAGHTHTGALPHKHTLQWVKMDTKDKLHVVYVKLSDYYLKGPHLSMLACLSTHNWTTHLHQKWIKPTIHIKYVWRI